MTGRTVLTALGVAISVFDLELAVSRDITPWRGEVFGASQRPGVILDVAVDLPLFEEFFGSGPW